MSPKADGPGVELMHAALAQRLRRLKAQQRVHLSQRVGDRRARGLDQRAAGPLAVEVTRFDEQVPGALRAVRIDAFQIHLIGGEGEFAEFLRLIDDDLVDADFFQRHHVVAPALQRRQFFAQLLLHRLKPLAGDAVAVVGARRDGLAGFDLLRDHRRARSRHGTGMKRNAAWVMITASQFAVAARARKRERFALTKLVSSATRMRAVG